MTQSALKSTPEASGNFFCEIVFVRHGETDWNRLQLFQHIARFQGQANTSLNANGRAQAHAVGTQLSRIIEETPGAIELDSNGERNSLCITKIFSSPLERAAQTAELIAQELNYPIKNIQLIDALAEWNVGKLQGTPIPHIKTNYPQDWRAWVEARDPNHVFGETGETLNQRYARVVEAIQSLANENCGARILVVCHAGVLEDMYRRCKLRRKDVE